MNTPTPEPQRQRQAMAADALPPTPPPNGPSGAQEQIAPHMKQNRQLLLAAAGAAVPPKPPEGPRDEERDPNRRYGFIITEGVPPRTQRYSYISDAERESKSAFLRANPSYDFPPGDPMNAPKDALFAWVMTMTPNGPLTATYWYRNDEEKRIARELVAGK